MALFGEVRSKPNKRQIALAIAAQRVLQIPEALVLGALLIGGWALGFPPLLGLLALIVMLAFAVRLGLMAVAERQLARGAYERADRLARAALRLNPWSSDTLVLQAQGLSQRGEDEAAEQVLRRAISLFPHDPQLQRALVSAVVAQGRISEGWQLAHTDDATAAESPVVTQQLAWFALHVEDNPARARSLIQRAQPERLPTGIALPLQMTLAEAQVALGAHGEARTLLTDVEQRLDFCSQPQQAELLYHIGRLYTVLGDGGAVYFRRSVEVDPSGRYAQAAWRSAVEAGS